MGLLGFTLLKALAERYRSPQQASRPFDRKRSGFVMSEGAGAVVLEALEHARSRGAPILGEILGYGDSADAYRITDTHPKGEGAILAMRGALEDAVRSPEEVDYINAHGTSTQQNDAIETMAIKEVFGDYAYKVPVSSIKSMIGHTLGASGAIAALVCLLAMRDGKLPPTINLGKPDPECDLDYIPNQARQAQVGAALSNSFAFGGLNAVVAFRAAPR